MNLAACAELPSSFTFEQVGITPLSDITPDKGLLDFGEGDSDNNATSLDTLLEEPVFVSKPFLRQREQSLYISRFQDVGNLREIKMKSTLTKQVATVKVKLFKGNLQSMGWLSVAEKLATLVQSLALQVFS